MADRFNPVSTGIGEVFKAANSLDAKRGDATLRAKAVWAVEELSMIQSALSVFQLNQTNALILGKLFGSCVCKVSAIQSALEPPNSLDPVSSTIIGLAGVNLFSSS